MIRLAPALAIMMLLAAAPASAQAARDFQLPPAPTPTPESRVQGPVDTDAPVPVRPRVIETARPATPTPAPTATSTPAIALPEPAPERSTSAAREPAVRSPQAAAPTARPGEPATGTTRNDPAAISGVVPQPVVQPTAKAIPSPPAVPAPDPESGLPWLWIVLAGSVALGGATFLAWRRRAASAVPPIIAPHIPAAATDPAEALAITVEAVRLDRSVLNATVGYRVTLRNRTVQALTGVAVEADLVSASRERPAEQQLASPAQALAPRHAADRLVPGQSLRFEGQVRLPLSEASVIRQGSIGLLIPLLRVRATAEGVLPVATTLVIGRSEGQAARPQPFRLDEPPRSYTPLAQRVLDAMPAQA